MFNYRKTKEKCKKNANNYKKQKYELFKDAVNNWLDWQESFAKETKNDKLMKFSRKHRVTIKGLEKKKPMKFEQGKFSAQEFKDLEERYSMLEEQYT